MHESTLICPPLGPPLLDVISHLVYVNGTDDTRPSFAILYGVQGPFRVTWETWQRVLLLRRSGSRFI